MESPPPPSSSSKTGTKRKMTNPPEGYKCHLCNEAGHWIFQCTSDNKKPLTNKKPKTTTTSTTTKQTHTPIPGVDPSPTDIASAKQMQKLKPPHCFCGRPSRLKKCKRSNVSVTSRANGNYFFFCGAKKREDGCRFARPVEHELKPKNERLCPFFARNGSCKKGDKCAFSHKVGEEGDGGEGKTGFSDAAAYIAEQSQSSQPQKQEEQQENKQQSSTTNNQTPIPSATESSEPNDGPTGESDGSDSDNSTTTSSSNNNNASDGDSDSNTE